MALNDLTRISTSGIATGSTIDSPILRKDVDFRGNQVGVTSALFDSSERELNLKDNVKLTFGDKSSGDLQLYHGGDHSFIKESGTGQLQVWSNQFRVHGADGAKTMLAAFQDGSVKLNFSNTTKFQTTQAGAVVTGILTATSFSGPIVGNTSSASGISTFYDLRVSNNLTVEGTTTTLDTNLIGVDRVEIDANSNTIAGIAVTQSGTADIVNLFDGNTKVLTVKDGGSVGIGTNDPLSLLSLGASANPTLEFKDFTNNARALIAGGANGQLVFQTDVGAVNANSDFIFRANSTTNEIVRFKGETGQVGIGTNDPTQLIDVYKTSNDAIIKTRTTAAGAYFEADSAAAAGYHGIRLSTSGTDKWFLGSYNSANFQIKDGSGASGAERFTIEDSTGNIGIGIANPDELLHIFSASGNSKIVLEADNNSANNGIYWVDEGDNTQSEFYYDHGGNKQHLNVNGNGLEIYSKQTSKVTAKIGHGSGYNDVVVPNGKLGVGTDNPKVSGLHVDGVILAGTPYIQSGLQYGGVRLEGNHSGTQSGGVIYGGAYGDNNHAIFFRRGYDGTLDTLDINEYGMFRIFTGGSLGSQAERLRITSGGDVGIGTDNPTQKLELYSGYSGRPTFRHSGGFGGVQIAGPQNASGASLMFTRGYDVVGGGTTTYSLFLAGSTQSLHFISGDPSEHQTKTRLLLNSSGKVGIGTNNPTNKFEVYGTDATVTLLNYGQSSGGLAAWTSGRLAFVSAHTNDDLVFGYSNSTLLVDNFVERMRIDNGTGEVRIANGGLLTINTNAVATYGISEAFRIDDNNVTNDRAFQIFEYQHSGARWFTINQNLHVTTDGSAYTYTQGNYSGSNMIKMVDGQLRIYNNPQVTSGSTDNITPTETVTILSDGNVGINHSSPTQKLHVDGSIKLSAQLMQSMPADFWSQGNTFIELNGVGNLTHMGSYETVLTSNGYRTNSTPPTWKSYAANSNTGAAQIRLNPAGYIVFAAEATKSDGDTDWRVDERLRIASDGVTTVTGELNIINSSNTTLKILDSSGDPDSYGSIAYNNGNDADDVLVIGVDGSNTQGSSHIRFYVDGLTSSAEKFRIDNSGNATIKNGNLVIGTSGHGIDFSATGNEGSLGSELLDDYETGTYTPTLTLGSGTVDSTVSTTLSYIKIGRFISLFGRLHFNTSASDVTSFTISLPIGNTSGHAYDTSTVFHVIRGSGGEPAAGIRIFRADTNSTVMRMQNANGGDYGNLGATNPHINVNFSYFCD